MLIALLLVVLPAVAGVAALYVIEWLCERASRELEQRYEVTRCNTYYEIGGIKTTLDDALGIQNEMARHGYKLPIYRVVNNKVVGVLTLKKYCYIC